MNGSVNGSVNGYAGNGYAGNGWVVGIVGTVFCDECEGGNLALRRLLEA